MKTWVAVSILFALVACTPAPSERPVAPESPSLVAVLDSLPSVPPYRRSEFGPAWHDTDGNGCNQRDDVLMRDATSKPTTRQQGSCGHDVLAGTWRDAYTGRTLTFTNLKEPSQAQAIQIDHVVSLSDAWVSGAAAWTAERRLEFANDLENLLAVDGLVNQAKKDGRPPRWLPEIDVCTYLNRYLTTKKTWGLGVTKADRKALRKVVEPCR